MTVKPTDSTTGAHAVIRTEGADPRAAVRQALLPVDRSPAKLEDARTTVGLGPQYQALLERYA